MLPTGDVRPAGQSEQVEDPARENLPMPQVSEQAAFVNPGKAPIVPAGQGVQDVEPDVE